MLIIEKENIGIMGLGNAGGQIADMLIKIDKKIIAYSRKKQTSNSSFLIFNHLDAFLAQTNILINALPLTTQTAGILNKKTFRLLPEKSCLINIGRGKHIIEDDLLETLETDQLSKVYLDVFATEPLPQKHPFWRHPKIVITPHIYQCKLFYEKAILMNPVDVQDLS